MTENPVPLAPSRPRLGLALGSGAARGWAHAGVLRALDDLGVEVDVYAGCSAGALVSGAHLLGIWDEFSDWAQRIGPVGAVATFGLQLSRGGLITPDKAFAQFMPADQPIEALAKPWGAVATDLATGKEVWLTQGSTLSACRASSAVPMVLQAASHTINDVEHWLIDGGASNPVPVSLARALGADRVISVDLNAFAEVITRFDRPTTREVVAVMDEADAPDTALPEAVEVFLKKQSRDISRRFALAKAKALSRPQFLETAIATIEIIQMQLANARAKVDVADLRLTPNLKGLSAASFDQWEQFDAIGYETAMAQREAILALAAPRHSGANTP